MASFDDDVDPTADDEFDNEDEEMEDANEPEQEADQEQDQDEDQNEEDEDEGAEEDDNDNDEDEDEDQNEPESPSRPASQRPSTRRSASGDRPPNPAVVLTSPSPRLSAARSPTAAASLIPSTRPEALTALAYDIVPTMAAPQSTSINAITTTPDMRWVFSGGTDGYVRMFNWVETANGKVPLTVAQKHPFVDSVMKAGSLVTYWENDDATVRTPPRDGEESKWLSPVYSLAVQHQAIWLLSGLESGGINLQTCRHQAGTRIATMKEHTSAVSVLTLSQDETNVLSGSWDKNIHDWDLQSGKVKRSFRGSGGQISAIETRPMSDMPVPEVVETAPEALNGTFASNNGTAPLINGTFSNGIDGRRESAITGGDADAAGSPSESLFGDGDHGSLFGEDAGGGGGASFGDEDDDLTRVLADGLRDDTDAPGEKVDLDAEMGGMGTGGPVRPPEGPSEQPAPAPDLPEADLPDGQELNGQVDGALSLRASTDSTLQQNGLPHSDEPLTAPPTTSTTNPADLPPHSESTFLSAAIDGTLRIWDRRISSAVATIHPHGSTPPWCTGACWSPDGNFFYAGRRNNTVEEYSIHHLGTKRGEPNRSFRFQAGSGPVYAVRAMPNKRHLVCASNDILRIYDLAQAESRRSMVPFTIVPGHRGGVISAIHVDPTCRFMLSAAGNRGWEGFGTEVLLGYEIGVQDQNGVWHK